MWRLSSVLKHEAWLFSIKNQWFYRTCFPQVSVPFLACMAVKLVCPVQTECEGPEIRTCMEACIHTPIWAPRVFPIYSCRNVCACVNVYICTFTYIWIHRYNIYKTYMHILYIFSIYIYTHTPISVGSAAGWHCMCMCCHMKWTNQLTWGQTAGRGGLPAIFEKSRSTGLLLGDLLTWYP